ncbi:hypothetical protein [Streptomyces sp. SS8]
MRDTRNGRAVRVKEDSADPPGVWSAYGRLLQHLGRRAGLSQQKLGDAIGYSEFQGVGRVVSDVSEVRAFSMRHGRLRSQALSVVESARLIGRLLGET